MRVIKLTKNKETFVDDDIYEAIGHLKWYSLFQGNNWYARRNSNKKFNPYRKSGTILLHHLIIGKPSDGLMINHIDGNGLNNQRTNLEVVTNQENSQRTKKHLAGKLVGVSLLKRKYKNKIYTYWRAYIPGIHRQIFLGLFKTENEAHDAYVKAINKGNHI